jgi:uncharacterized membrane protein YgdD (TMEM256/DUF423 family)
LLRAKAASAIVEVLPAGSRAGLRVVAAIGGLLGAAGVALAAVAAHVAGAGNLATAANMLILHAAAAIAVAAFGVGAGLGRPALVCAGAMLLGVALFAGDLVMRQFAGIKLLWGTAPFGGTIMIAAWLGFAAMAAFWRTPPSGPT